mmetsp:Transcript_65473/g.108948  ORF Transcript_65473/g.108948 Transcript_65473/m.108948 type:complete len:117 (-) Transcript_65473:173-523(-)
MCCIVNEVHTEGVIVGHTRTACAQRTSADAPALPPHNHRRCPAPIAPKDMPPSPGGSQEAMHLTASSGVERGGHGAGSGQDTVWLPEATCPQACTQGLRGGPPSARGHGVAGVWPF